MSEPPVINMQSVMNLSYKSAKSIRHPKPPDFQNMRARAAQKKDLYLKRSDLRNQVLKLLVPNKDEIERQKSCDCGS